MYKYKKSKKKKILLLCNQSPANQVVFFVFDIEIWHIGNFFNSF